MKILSNSNLEYEEIINDLQEMIEEEVVENVEFADQRAPHQMTWDQYHSSEVMLGYMHYLEKQYPNLVTLYEMGKSYENRSLVVAKVSYGPNKPAIWIDGGIHAREWISPSTVLYILKELVEFQAQNEDIVSTFDWYILPMSNPDGYEYSRHFDRLWRKTRSVHSGLVWKRCVGVDANRNFGYKWRTGGSSSHPCSDIYAGPSSFSEPETAAMRDFILERKDQLKVYLSLHSYTQMWLLPWGHTAELPQNYKDLDEVARASASAMKAYNNTEYSVGTVSQLMYTASGGSGDFAYGAAGIPFSYAIELRDLGKYGFILPKEQILPSAHETFEGVKVLAAEVFKRLHKYRKPIVENAEVVTPPHDNINATVENAEVVTPPHDNTNSSSHSNNTSA